MTQKRTLQVISIVIGLGAGYAFMALALMLLARPDIDSTPRRAIQALSLNDTTPPPVQENPRTVAHEHQVMTMAIPMPQLKLPSVTRSLDFALPQMTPNHNHNVAILPDIAVPSPAITTTGDAFGSTTGAELTFKPDLHALFPRRARSRGIEGRSVVSFIIDETGAIEEDSIIIISSTPPGYFERAAKKVIKRCTYKPAMKNGKAIAQRKEQSLQWTLPK